MKRKNGLFSMVWKLMYGLRTMYLMALASIALATFFQFMIPLVIRVTIDSILGGKPIELPLGLGERIESIVSVPLLVRNLWLASIALVILTLLANLFTYLRGRWSRTSAEEFSRRIRDVLYDHIQKLPFAWHSRVQTGDIVQRCTSDVDTVRRFFGMQLVQVGRGIIMISLVTPIMFSLNREMAFVSLIVVPIIIAYSFFFYRKIREVFKETDEEEGYLTTVLEESMSGIRVVKAFARQEYEIERFNSTADSFRSKSYRLIVVLAWYWSLSDMLCMLQIAAVLIFGTHLAIAGTITLGTLVVFMTYIGSMLWPIREMGRVLTDLGRAIVSLGRIKEILDTAEEDLSGIVSLTPKRRLQGRIEFRGLSFGYDEQHDVLKNINLTIEQGETVAIIGATGAGKSSLVHLIPRLFDYQKGSLLIDGKELRDYQRQQIRRQIGIVLQEPFLYSRTIRENIGIALPETNMEMIRQVAKEAALDETIMEFEKGYDTIVGEKGITLSGGQRQRTAIARALILDPPILILDDSLSAVDSETEKIIQAHLKRRKGRATTIIITHRFTSLSIADRIIVMEHGEIVQCGTHKELIVQDGHYRDIWTIQHQLEQEAG